MDNDRTGSENREYTNGEITVYWRPSECIHVSTCYRELIAVFNPRKRPWINMKGATTGEIIKTVDLCPTNALTYVWNKDIGKNTDASAEKKVDTIPKSEDKVAEIKVMQNGPLVVKGNFKIIGADGVELRQMKMASFCRCGHSQSMPFCDGTHRKIGFADSKSKH